MIKYFCDLCEKELKEKDLVAVTFPTLFGGMVIMSDRNDPYLVCKDCAKEYYDIVHNFRMDKIKSRKGD